MEILVTLGTGALIFGGTALVTPWLQRRFQAQGRKGADQPIRQQLRIVGAVIAVCTLAMCILIALR